MARLKKTSMNCRIFYRRCVFEGAPPGLNLQQLVFRALRTKDGHAKISDSWKHRLHDMSFDGDASDLVFVNHLRGHSADTTTSIFGDLSRYQVGAHKATIDQVEDAAELKVNLLPPNEQQEFLDGMLWWRLSGNHLLAVQGRSVRWSHLESYFRWLLQERTKALGTSTSFIFSPNIQPAATHQAAAKVKSVTVKGAVPSGEFRDAGSSRTSEQRGKVDAEIVPRSKLRSMLEGLVPDHRQLNRLMGRIPDGEDVKIEVTLKFPGVRAMPEQLRLSSVQDAFDAIVDADVTVDTDRGPIRLGSMVQHPEQVIKVGSYGGIWDRDELYGAFGTAWGLFHQQGFLTS